MKKTILFVDDDRDILDLANIFVFGIECNLLLANSGEKAIEIISNNDAKIDLIFLDLMMAGIDGFEVLEHIKSLGTSIPVIVQSGIIHDDDLRRAKELGAIDFIQKPYTTKIAKDLINRYISNKTIIS